MSTSAATGRRVVRPVVRPAGAYACLKCGRLDLVASRCACGAVLRPLGADLEHAARPGLAH